MWLYLDTSALLRVELERDHSLGKTIGAATHLLTCGLTRVEAARAIRRLERMQPRSSLVWAAAEQKIRETLDMARIAPLDEAVLRQAEQAVPLEPLRPLDAIHLSSAIWWRGRLGPGLGQEDLAFASTDKRLRANAAALGFSLVPA